MSRICNNHRLTKSTLSCILLLLTLVTLSSATTYPTSKNGLILPRHTPPHHWGLSYRRLVNHHSTILNSRRREITLEKDWEALSFLRGGALEDDSSSDEEGDSDVESDSDSETESEDSDESEEDSDSDDESESEVEESDSEAEESSDDEEETDSDYEEESSDEEEETEPETSISTKTSQSKASSSDVEEYDEPLSFSPMQDMGVTLGVMILCNRLDLNNAKIVKVAR